MLPYQRGLKHLSQELRTRMTDAEAALWQRLRRKQLSGLQFYRQKPLGNFIVDFYCPKANLVIEIDGGQHFTDEGKASDAMRDEQLESMGLTIMRFSNSDVLQNIDGVATTIHQHLEDVIGSRETNSP